MLKIKNQRKFYSDEEIIKSIFRSLSSFWLIGFTRLLATFILTLFEMTRYQIQHDVLLVHIITY